MLANAFLTPADLQITDAEFEALVKVLGMLEREELVRAKPKPCAGLGPFTGHFNMAFFNTATECGTVCCIAGTAALLMGKPFNAGRTPQLKSLCYPLAAGPDWEIITPPHAAIALRDYLTHGDTNWVEAMSS